MPLGGGKVTTPSYAATRLNAGTEKIGPTSPRSTSARRSLARQAKSTSDIRFMPSQLLVDSVPKSRKFLRYRAAVNTTAGPAATAIARRRAGAARTASHAMTASSHGS